MPNNIFTRFINLEAAAGIFLLSTALLALILANSPWSAAYYWLLNTPIQSPWDALAFPSLLEVINDGLMTLFFLQVTLEVKREWMVGELNSFKKASLPVVAALGGVLLPAIIYCIINLHHAHYLAGWAIPTATDITFALGVLTLVGSRVPASLKIFLTTLAIIDDIAAIAIITFFYTEHLAWIALVYVALSLLILLSLNYFTVDTFWPYGIAGLFLWVATIKLGVHPSIAGVLLALAIPLRTKKNVFCTLFKTIEQKLHAWVMYGILPVFVFANAGLSLAGMSVSIFSDRLFLGIACGLFFGKQLGIAGASWLAIKCRFAKLPSLVSWKQFYGMAVVCGVGFTMSLFIGALAFSDHELVTRVQAGIFLASLFSGIVGYLLLRF